MRVKWKTLALPHPQEPEPPASHLIPQRLAESPGNGATRWRNLCPHCCPEPRLAKSPEAKSPLQSQPHSRVKPTGSVNDVGLDALDLGRMKQEILEEVVPELHKVKEEIIDAIIQEISGISTTQDGASPGGSRGAVLAQHTESLQKLGCTKSQPVIQY
ncbi:ena VASP isoform X2 [Sigmodon hispidus]